MTNSHSGIAVSVLCILFFPLTSEVVVVVGRDPGRDATPLPTASTAADLDFVNPSRFQNDKQDNKTTNLPTTNTGHCGKTTTNKTITTEVP